MKESVCFSKTDVFVPVSQLSTRDLLNFKVFFFLEKKGFSRLVWSCKQRALWFSYSRLFFGMVFKKVLFLEYLEFLQSQLWCPSWIFDTSLSERCFFLNVCWLIKVIITFESRETCRECLFVLRDFVTWLSLLFFLRFFLFVSGEKRI